MKEPTPLAEIVAQLVARAERGPAPSPVAAATLLPRYRPRYFRHPLQLALPFPTDDPDGTPN